MAKSPFPFVGFPISRISTLLGGGLPAWGNFTKDYVFSRAVSLPGFMFENVKESLPAVLNNLDETFRDLRRTEVFGRVTLAERITFLIFPENTFCGQWNKLGDAPVAAKLTYPATNTLPVEWQPEIAARLALLTQEMNDRYREAHVTVLTSTYSIGNEKGFDRIRNTAIVTTGRGYATIDKKFLSVGDGLAPGEAMVTAQEEHGERVFKVTDKHGTHVPFDVRICLDAAKSRSATEAMILVVPAAGAPVDRIEGAYATFVADMADRDWTANSNIKTGTYLRIDPAEKVDTFKEVVGGSSFARAATFLKHWLSISPARAQEARIRKVGGNIEHHTATRRFIETPTVKIPTRLIEKELTQQLGDVMSGKKKAIDPQGHAYDAERDRIDFERIDPPESEIGDPPKVEKEK